MKPGEGPQKRKRSTHPCGLANSRWLALGMTVPVELTELADDADDESSSGPDNAAAEVVPVMIPPAYMPDGK